MLVDEALVLELIHRERSRHPRIGGRKGLLGSRPDRVHAVVEERVDQLLLVVEAAVDGPDTHACVVGDVVERDLEATRGEDLAGGREDALAIAGCIAAERPFVAHGLTCVGSHKDRIALNGGQSSVFRATLGSEVET